MKYLIVILFLFCTFCISDLQAQIIDLEKVAKRTQRKIERRAQRKIDRTIDDGLDEAEDGLEGKKKNKKEYEDEKYESENSSDLNNRSSADSDISLNSFRGKIMITVLKIDEFGNEFEYRFKYISKKESSILIPQSEYKDIDFVFLNNQSKTVIVAKNINDEKTGTKDFFKYFDRSDGRAYTTIKTDETEIINDFICRKYILESQASTVVNWSSQELALDYGKFLMELNYLGFTEGELSSLNPSPFAVMDAEIEKMNGENLVIKLDEVIEGNFDFSNYDISEYNLLDYTEY